MKHKKRYIPLVGSTHTARQNFGCNLHTIHFLGKGGSKPSENNLLNQKPKYHCNIGTQQHDIPWKFILKIKLVNIMQI